MSDFHSVEPLVSLERLPVFMVHWTILFKCNLDCSYCSTHDNSESPLPLEELKKSADFIMEYVDVVMTAKTKHHRRASLNLIGGEPFIHPNILEILQYVHQLHQTKYQSRWKLSVVVTTNGLFGNNLLKKCIGLIDQWTVSYHAETLPKQKALILKNIRTLHNSNQRLEVRVLAHPDVEKFKEAQNVHMTLVNEGVTALMKPIIDHKYKKDETQYFKIFWQGDRKEEITNYCTTKGITCCSDRPLIFNREKERKVNFIPDNNFKGWYCALDWTYLFLNRHGQVFHTSCRVSQPTGKIEPIGTSANYQAIINKLKDQIEEKKVKPVVCPKDLCYGCGMCAPKSRTKEEFKEIMKDQLLDVSMLDFS